MDDSYLPLDADSSENQIDEFAELPEDCTFADFIKEPEILSAVERLGFKTPTENPTPSESLSRSAGRDIIAQAQTGSGKTLAFVVPMLQALKATGREKDLSTTFAIAVVPTRELALQVGQVVNSLTDAIHPVCVIGGADVAIQTRELKQDARIVVGTPGRLLDLLKQKILKLKDCHFFALDEVDEMLSIGFIEDVRSILSRLPDRRQGMFVSATITPRVEMLAHSFLDHPRSILVEKEGSKPPSIEHLYCEIGGDLMAKPAALCDIIETLRPRSAIIFCNTKSDTLLVEALLRRRGFDARRINSDLTQAQRERVMKIRKGELQFLVATDIAARGLDIEQIDLVINYAIHEQPEAYIHRTGRTGRAGRSGKAISLIGPRDFGAFHFLTKVVDLKFNKMPVPTDAEVADARITHLYEMLRLKEIDLRERDILVARQLLREMGAITEAPEELESIVAKLCRYTVEHFLSSEAKSLDEELEAQANADAPQDHQGRDDQRKRGRRDRGEQRGGRREDEGAREPREQRSRRSESGTRDDAPQTERAENQEQPRAARSEEPRGEHRENRGEGRREPRQDDRGEGRREPRQDDRREGRRDDRNNDRRGGNEVRVYIGQGLSQGMTPDALGSLAKEFAEIEGNDLKNISMRDHYGFADLPEPQARKLITSLHGIEYNGTPLSVELAAAQSSRERGPDNRRGGQDRREGGRGRGSDDRRHSRGGNDDSRGNERRPRSGDRRHDTRS